MTEEISSELSQQLATRWQVTERPFTSNAPLIGPLIVRLRRLWNNVSTTWYVRPLVQQQNEYNHLLRQSIHQLAEVAGELDGRLTAADQEQTELRVQVAELVTAVQQMNRRLAALEAQLDQAEARR
jgi:hypothetical protein